MNRIAAAALVLGLLLGASISYAAISFYPDITSATGATSPSTRTTTLGSPPAQSTATTPIEGIVTLDAPFNGTTATVLANVTVGGYRSTPLSETIAALYVSVPNGNATRFKDYTGTFVAATVATIPKGGENATLSVSYDGHSGSTTMRIYQAESKIQIPVVLRTLPESSPPAELTTSDANNVCGILLDGGWNAGSNECTLTSVHTGSLYYLNYSQVEWTLYTQLTIDPGVTLYLTNGAWLQIFYNGAELINRGTIIVTDVSEIDNYGAIYNYGTMNVTSSGVVCLTTGCADLGSLVNNYDRIFNEGTLAIFGGGAQVISLPGPGISNSGTIDNSWTLVNYAYLNNTGTVNDYHDGVLTNGGVVNNVGTVNLWVPDGGWVYTCGSTAMWNDNQPLGADYGTNSFYYTSC